MYKSGVFIRAGVAIGNVGLDGSGPAFGPAMVRAYEIESVETIYPRIVVDDAAYEEFLSDVRLRNENDDLKEEADCVNGLLRTGDDETRFTDYLFASENEFDAFEDYIFFFGRHAALIRKNLAAPHRPYHQTEVSPTRAPPQRYRLRNSFLKRGGAVRPKLLALVGKEVSWCHR